MEHIWAPWRMEYIEKKKESDCIFCCTTEEEEDKENYILYRGDSVFVIMNAYPYNNGHLMVIPYEHVSSFEFLDDKVLLDLMKTTNISTTALRSLFSPDGFNIGANLGKVAGAGIESHVHIHVVPRWNGDTNFMPVIGDTKVISEHLESTYLKLLPYFK
ncbi:MAG: HIT domain-containing protein [Nitrospirota bacterium]